MDYDFDNLMEMHVVRYDRDRAKSVVRALVELSLDAERQRAARAKIARPEKNTLDKPSKGGYNLDTQVVSTHDGETLDGKDETEAGGAGG